MSTNEQDARQSIIDIVRTMIDETDDIEKITTRQIAKRAGVGIGLINYHFKSKDNLLSIAIGDVMTKIICNFTKDKTHPGLHPREKLKMMLKELSSLAGSDQKLIQFILTRELLGGNMQTALHLVPLLKEIFGSAKDDTQIRVIALQILHPIQVTVLNHDSFHMYSGIDLTEADQRNHFIDVLIDNITSENVD